MKKLLTYSAIGFLSAAMLMGCQRDRGVEAGNDPGRTDTYQPRPAPGEVPGTVTPETGSQSGTQYGAQSNTQSGSQSTWGNAQNQEIRGELTRVDMAKKTITVRVENGMEQTFKWNDESSVQGTESRNNSQRQSGSGNQMADLKGKEGSGVTIMWRDDNGAKMATNVTVTQMGVKNSSSNKTNTHSNTTSPKGASKDTY